MDTLRLTIEGRGGHASAQYLAVNPTPIAAEVILAMEAAAIRQVSPAEPAIVTFSTMESTSAPTGPVVPPGTPTPNNHSATVRFDEAAMPVGAALHAAVALRHLGDG